MPQSEQNSKVPAIRVRMKPCLATLTGKVVAILKFKSLVFCRVHGTQGNAFFFFFFCLFNFVLPSQASLELGKTERSYEQTFLTTSFAKYRFLNYYVTLHLMTLTIFTPIGDT